MSDQVASSLVCRSVSQHVQPRSSSGPKESCYLERPYSEHVGTPGPGKIAISIISSVGPWYHRRASGKSFKLSLWTQENLFNLHNANCFKYFYIFPLILCNWRVLIEFLTTATNWWIHRVWLSEVRLGEATQSPKAITSAFDSWWVGRCQPLITDDRKTFHF